MARRRDYLKREWDTMEAALNTPRGYEWTTHVCVCVCIDTVHVWVSSEKKMKHLTKADPHHISKVQNVYIYHTEAWPASALWP